MNKRWKCGLLTAGWPLLAAMLMVSCHTRQELALKELSAAGVEASGRSLVLAVTEGNARITGLLLETQVYTEQRDNRGLTPLGIAVSNRDRDIAVMLLNARANVNASLANQTSILGIAAAQGDTSMLNLLLAGGADPDGLMPGGAMILPWAIRENRHDIVRAMMKADSDPHLKDRSGNPLLHIAMEAGRRDLMHTLIELGADPAATNAAGETTIQLALRQGWPDIIPALAAAGADPNATNPDGLTLLEQGLADRNPEHVALFLKIGADPHFRSHQSPTRSPFQTAFDDPAPTMFRIFLDHGTLPPPGGWSPWLWQAFRNRDIAKARLMLAHGARNPAPGTGGLTLVESAALAGDVPFLKLLLDYGLPAGRALHIASTLGHSNAVEIILAAGIPPDFTPVPSPDTTLIAAVRSRHDTIAELLIRHGARTDLTPPEGQSLLHLAIATGCHRTVKQLLADGADPNASFSSPVSAEFIRLVRPGVMRWILKNDQNATPLMLAADSGNIQTTRTLMKAGAKSNVRTRKTSLWPINFASRRNDVKMMRLFLGRDPYREDRRIEISLSEQRARIFDSDGKEIWTTKVSSGRKGFATPTGEYVITNKYRDWTSTLYDASMPYFQRLSCGDFGLHQGNVPGYPASHGCIRVPAGNAAKLFTITQTGDRVNILP